jgi:transglutaminase-like putative cysteine protease
MQFQSLASQLKESSSLSSAQAPRQAVLLERIYRLRERVSDPAMVDRVLDAARTRQSMSPLARVEVDFLSSKIAVHGGDLERNSHTSSQNLGDLLSIANARSADEDSPANLETLFWLETFGRIPEAEKHLQRLLQLNPTPELLFEAADLKSNLREKTELLRAALRSDPDYFPALLKLAELESGRGENLRAALFLNGYLKRHPCEAEAVRLSGDLNQALGDNSAALRQWNDLASRAGKSLELRFELASRFAQLGFLEKASQLVESALSQNFDGDQEWQLKIRLQEQSMDAQGLLNSYRALHRLYPNDLFIEKKLLAARGRADESGRDVRDAHTVPLPSKDARPVVLHSVVAERQLPSRDRDESSYEAGLRRLLTGENVELAENEDQRYLEDALQAAARWRMRPRSERESSRILAEVKVQHLSSNAFAKNHVQRIVAVASLADAGNYSVQSVRYSPESEQLAILRARVLKADGHVVEAEDLGDGRVSDSQSAMYYAVRSHNLRFPHLQPGDVTEIEYRISSLEDENPYGRYFAEVISFGSEMEKDLQRYILISPSAIKVYFNQKGVAAPDTYAENDVNVHSWEARNLKAVVREGHSPAWSEQAPYVHVSTFRDWEELGKWYAQLIAPQFAVGPVIERLAEEIRTRNHGELEQIRATHEFVMSNTRYVALEFGIYSYKPYPVEQTLARKFGDCKDKASLIIALLRQMGIEAELALVRTQRLGTIQTAPASVAVFDHAIVYVPKYDLWLDGTADFSGLRELPVEDQGAIALTVNLDGNARLKRIPISAPLDNYTRRSVLAQLDPEGVLHFSGVNYVRGQDAPEMRRDFARTDRQREFLQGRLAEVLPSVQLQAVSISGPDLEKDFTLTYRGEIQSSGNRLVSIPSSWMPRPYLAALAASPRRTQPLLLSAPWTTEEELHIRLTGNSVASNLPTDYTVQNEFGSASIRYTREGNELVITSSVQFRKLRIRSEEYLAFRDFVRTLDEAFRRDVQVKLQ